MADKKGKYFDLWVLDTQKVYREVPYNAAVDWVQQGRLLDDDRLRPSGTAAWVRVGDMLEVKPFLPKLEPHRAEDRAESLEPVEVDFAYRRPRLEEDDDVDMIPLIDVSLVLLVFFMLTAAGGAGAIDILVPTTAYSSSVHTPEGLMIGIDLVDNGDQKIPVYSISEASTPPAADDRNIGSLAELLQKVDAKLQGSEARFVVTINAHQDVKSGVVRELTAELERPARRKQISAKYFGVKEENP